MAFTKNEEVKSDARWVTNAEGDKKVEERRGDLYISASKHKGSSSLYEFQNENDDDDSSLEDSTSCDESSDSEQSTANVESTLVNLRERKRERTQSKVRKCGQALLQAKKDKTEAQNALLKAKKVCQVSRENFNAALDAAGVSPQLIDEYQAFCKSLQPKISKTGFSIICHKPHDGNYVDYDPEFNHFKDNVERSYKNKNFRCEASSTIGKVMDERRRKRAKVTEYLVEFFPLLNIEPVIGSERTWGDQYISDP